jgi:hypothetical protein
MSVGASARMCWHGSSSEKALVQWDRPDRNQFDPRGSCRMSFMPEKKGCDRVTDIGPRGLWGKLEVALNCQKKPRRSMRLRTSKTGLVNQHGLIRSADRCSRLLSSSWMGGEARHAA